MPIFNLVCNKCGYLEEVICSFDKSGEYICPMCGNNLVRMVCKAGFKVNGFSASNGYSRPEIGYNNDPQPW